MTDPLLDAAMRGWIVKKAQKEFWRVARYYELEDLIQDGYMCYAKCKARYIQFAGPNPTKDQRKHFMALVQRAYSNHIHTLAARRLSVELLAADCPVEELAQWDDWVLQEGPLRHLLARAPGELLAVAQLLATDLTPLARSAGNFRESRNEKVSRCLGLPRLDWAAAWRKYMLD